MDKTDAGRTAVLLERVGRLINQEAHADGLQPVQWEALRYLDRANRFSRTAGALTAYLGLTKGTVSQTLKALESKALIRKEPDKKDRRSNRLVLTARGRRQLVNDPLAATAGALEGLPKQTQRELGEGLSEFLNGRLGAEQRQPFGQCRDCRYFARKHPEGNPHYCQLLHEQLNAADSEAICLEQEPATS